MRTASRLDLVPKSLTLVGLCVLGLSAALLDRWSTEFPAVPRPGIDAAAPAVQVGLVLHDVALPALAPPTARRPVPETKSPAPTPEAVTVETASAPSDEPVDRTAPQLPVPVESWPVQGSVVALSVPPPVATWQLLASSPPVATEGSDEGFFSGVLKKTSSSVSNSLGKASNSVVGAARVFGGAVKRVF